MLLVPVDPTAPYKILLLFTSVSTLLRTKFIAKFPLKRYKIWNLNEKIYIYTYIFANMYDFKDDNLVGNAGWWRQRGELPHKDRMDYVKWQQFHWQSEIQTAPRDLSKRPRDHLFYEKFPLKLNRSNESPGRSKQKSGCSSFARLSLNRRKIEFALLFFYFLSIVWNVSLTRMDYFFFFFLAFGNCWIIQVLSRIFFLFREFIYCFFFKVFHWNWTRILDRGRWIEF